jgi:hypothetical protein
MPYTDIIGWIGFHLFSFLLVGIRRGCPPRGEDTERYFMTKTTCKGYGGHMIASLLHEARFLYASLSHDQKLRDRKISIITHKLKERGYYGTVVQQ